TYDEVHADPDAAMRTILDRYRVVAAQCEAVLVVGSDYTDVDSPTEFSFNARIAADLGAPVLLVLNGRDRSPDDVHAVAEMATAELTANYGTLVGVIANRVDPDLLEPTRSALEPFGPAFALPEQPLLSAPTVADLVEAGGGSLFRGDPDRLGRESLGLVIAGMTLPNVLDRLIEDGVLITPSDRSDVLLGVLMAHASTTFPSLAGVVLNGGFALPDQVVQLIDGLDLSLPIISMPGDTFPTATRLAAVRGRLTKHAGRKIQTALGLFEDHVDTADLLDRLDVTRSDAVTPLMFEHDLVDRARSDRKHIVLPEADDDRILKAADTVLRRGIAQVTLLGRRSEIESAATRLGVDVSGAQFVDPQDSDLRER